jgi:hypothetical protein
MAKELSSNWVVPDHFGHLELTGDQTAVDTTDRHPLRGAVVVTALGMNL